MSLLRRLLLSFSLCLIVGMAGGSAHAKEVEELLDGYCKTEGYTQETCACFKSTYTGEAAVAGMTPGQIKAGAFLLGQSALAPMDIIAVLGTLDQNDLPAATMALSQVVLPKIETCLEGPESGFQVDMSASLTDRHVAACALSDPEMLAFCQCQATRMEETLDDPFMYELFVELAEAEAQNASNPLEVVAEARGLSLEDAELAFEGSQQTMMRLMGPIMTCMNETLDPAVIDMMTNGMGGFPFGGGQ